MRCFGFLLLFAVTLLDLPGQTALRSARAAQARLGPSLWSRVVQIENANRRSRYAKREYALVFEFAGILWFYSEIDGTQSFSRFTNRLAQEKADFGDGLRAIEPGFVAYSVLDDTSEVPDSGVRIPNGCLIESIVAAQDHTRRGEPILKAKLVLFYSAGRREGHCVLAFETPEGVFAQDPSGDGKTRRVGTRWPNEPAALALAAWPEGRANQISKVRTLNCPIVNGSSEHERVSLAAARNHTTKSDNLAEAGHG